MCTTLAQDGKCEENADSMLKRCPLACNACLGEPGKFINIHRLKRSVLKRALSAFSKCHVKLV